MTGETKDPIAILKGVRALLAKREAWTKGAGGRDLPGGSALPALSASATCWCLSGAITRVSYSDRVGTEPNTPPMKHEPLAMLANAIRREHPESGHADSLETVVRFNDAAGRQHEDVLKVLDAAIERAPA